MVNKAHNRIALSTRRISFIAIKEKADATINDSEDAPNVEELRQANCWRLWQERGLTVKEICYCLRMKPETVITNIVSCARTIENVDWCRLCNLIKMTPDMAESILVGRTKATLDFSSSNNATVLCVTPLHIMLVHVMLGRGLSSSEILQIINVAVTDNGTVRIEGNVDKESLSLAATDSGQSQDVYAKPNKKAALRGVLPGAGSCNTGKENSKILNTNSSPAIKQAYVYIDNGGTKVVTMFGIIQYLEDSNGATLTSIAQAFKDCDEVCLIRLLLVLVENSVIIRSRGKFRILLNKCIGLQSEDLQINDKLKFPGDTFWQVCSKISEASLIRIQRARELSATVLGSLTHEPKRDVEFIIISIKCNGDSRIYRVRICKFPSCTCPDFSCRHASTSNYIPCKHLFYVYLRELKLKNDVEHVMHQASLTEADLEIILQSYH